MKNNTNCRKALKLAVLMLLDKTQVVDLKITAREKVLNRKKTIRTIFD